MTQDFEAVFQQEISDLVEQLRFPKTTEHVKEAQAVAADLMVAVNKLRAWEVRRGDWLPC